MDRNVTQKAATSSLRTRAEEALKDHGSSSAVVATEPDEMVHELHVHQAELEIQNDELRRAQLELSALHREYADLYEFAPCGYLTLNPRGIITRANLTAVRLLGADRLRLLSSGLSFYVAPGFEAALGSALKKAGQSSVRQSLELPFKSATTNPTWLQADIEAHRDDNRGILQWRVVLTDISDRRKAQAAALEAERGKAQAALLEAEKSKVRQWRGTFDAIGDAVWVIGNDREIHTMNAACAELFGKSLDELAGLTCCEAMHGEKGPIPDCPWMKMCETKEPQRLQVAIADRSVEVSVHPLLDEGGRLTGAVHIAIDITNQKRDEAARAALEEQLAVSQKLEAVGLLAGGVAHDFNNMLAAILGNAELALGEPGLNDSLRKKLLAIEQAGERSHKLVGQLLAFSRRQMLQPKTIELNAVVSELCEMLARLLGEDIEIRQVLAPDLSSITVDKAQLEQAIINLAVNARDAMPGGGTLTITTANVDIDEDLDQPQSSLPGGPYVELSISDTGQGMDEQTLAHAFEPFFTTKAIGKGTGLGLSTTYGFVKQSGGELKAHSAKGQGTTFTVFLPVPVSVAPRVSLPNPPSPRLAGTETILLVEDEPFVRNVTRDILKEAGYTVLVASNGVEALSVAEAFSGDIHLALTDAVMPRMNGRALADKLSTARPATKVLFMSGYNDSTIVQRGVLHAGVQFIGKPFRGSELRQKVRDVLDEQRQEVSDPHACGFSKEQVESSERRSHRSNTDPKR
ncbi:MAG: response regulator [Myxococcota bacterium]|jgi:PAS domain S-box-containing protein|nr:response regulator [Myxococcota bacterium]